MSFNTIIDPVNGNEYSISSPEGRKLLKSYVTSIMSGGANRNGNTGGNPLGRQGNSKKNARVRDRSQKNKKLLETVRTMRKQAKSEHTQKQIYMRRKHKYGFLKKRAANVMKQVPEFNYLNDTIYDYINYLAANPDMLGEFIHGGSSETEAAETTAGDSDGNDNEDINKKIDEIHNNIKMANLETYATPTKILSSLSEFVYDSSLSFTDRLGMMLMMLQTLQYAWTILGVSVDPPEHVGIMFDSYTDYVYNYIDNVEEEVTTKLVADGISRRDVFTTEAGIKYSADSLGSKIPKSVITYIQKFIEGRKYANSIKLSIFVVSGLLMGLLHGINAT
jgi:hypothetical protein